MYEILLAVDSNVEQSLRSAAVVTGLPRASDEIEVTALNVFEEFDATDAGGRASSEDLFEDQPAPESLERTVEFLTEHGVSSTAERRHGEPPEEITNAARELDVDLIVMGGRRRSPVGKALFGSVVQAVLLDADRPVTVSLSD
ncbi:universal stress protein [Natrinema salifodinae]|uniref:Nucleotide-binding universal stress protein, UspA family n=1 Tax=Natrinema salifodinae TaxID=1202768 RepID=A0A1I0LX98_9EURY|nr:universal stress protein [Natrinema salifodinae]SEV80024.1 Nucleotide-binding universal stress protein, UspA family [Natrinema salifodinae]